MEMKTEPPREALMVDAQERHPDSTSDTSSDTVAITYPSVWRQAIIVTGLLLGIFLAGLDINIIATAIPAITSNFNSLAESGWYGSSFFLAYSAFQSLWGKAYKYFDMKYVFLASMLVFEIGCLIGGIAPSSAVLIVGRVVQGAGAAGILSGCYSIAGYVSPADKVPLIIGMIGTIFSIASVIGPLLGGIFTSDPHLTWRWCFYINLPIGGVPIFIIFFFFKTPPHAKTANKDSIKDIALSFDPLGVILFAAALASYLLALTWGGTERAWNSSTIIGTLIAWILLTIVFVVNEFWQGERALIVVRLFKNRDMWVNGIVLFFYFGAYFAIVYSLPIYFQAALELTPGESGIRTIPIIGSTSVASLFGSVLFGKYGRYTLFQITGIGAAAIAGGLIYTLDIDTSLGKQIGYQLLLGAGIGWIVQIPPIVAGIVNKQADKPVGTAAVLVIQFYSASIGISAASAIINNILIQKVPVYAPEVTPAEILSIGPYDLSARFSGATLLGIKKAYIDGLRASWILSIALWGVAFFCTFLAKWPGHIVPAKEEGASDTQEKTSPTALHL
ncbi:putative gliotoxin efflux pump [Xylaria bambusicola]|uniref:putative gliotoxin efflux pump n=1 Tax=Xylaria bambusicola TaxID=326684 RepID=UPI0020083E06|nr:putative gliotoxin efflux pump [Xylaria bambusicola]KAI0514719.1 putative gliotoxin efflux pump [Xylaria bambusicola]